MGVGGGWQSCPRSPRQPFGILPSKVQQQCILGILLLFWGNMWLRIYLRKSWRRGPWLSHREGGQCAWPPTWPSKDLRRGPQTESQCSMHLARWGVCARVRVCVRGQKRKRCTCTSTGRRKTTEVLEEQIYKDSSREKDSLCIHHLSQPISYLGSILDVIIKKKKIIGRSPSTKSFYDLVLKPRNFPFWSSRITKIFFSPQREKKKTMCVSLYAFFGFGFFSPRAPGDFKSEALPPHRPQPGAACR